ncbi:MAG: methyltransferase domain-containing protein [Chitinispirillaceae bacterium]|jgi:acetyltransferase-like isoleucine patch superfamily enzyme|nr:methyltransferase domain-containing protein [Chitinispirillaceae bacterium]
MLINHAIVQKIQTAIENDRRKSGTPPEKSRGTFKNLFNQPVTLEYGQDSYIDPDVVVDTPEKIKIGANTIIRKGVVLRPEGGEIVIGDNCVINHYSVFHGKGGIYLGDWCIVAPHCGFYAQNHSYDRFDIPITRQENIGRGIYLMGDNWIGSHSVVCDDVTLGKGVVVGANATVTKSMPMASICAGSPATVLKSRFKKDWDFNERERAAASGMPANLVSYVQHRGELLKQFISSDDTVLDIGCGEGIISAKIAEKTPSVIGCDYCHAAVKDAQTRNPAIRFVPANVTCLTFEKDSFSMAVFSEVAEHLLPMQFRKALLEIARVLRRDGTLLLTTPVTGAGFRTSTYAHIYEYSRQEILDMLGILFNEVEFLNPQFGLFRARNKK